MRGEVTHQGHPQKGQDKNSGASSFPFLPPNFMSPYKIHMLSVCSPTPSLLLNAQLNLLVPVFVPQEESGHAD